MAEDDNFDLDIYGDDVHDDEQANPSHQVPVTEPEPEPEPEQEQEQEPDAAHGAEDDDRSSGTAHPNEQTPIQNQSPPKSNPIPAKPVVQPKSQGVKRKGIDERPVDVNSTNAVQLTELNWWVTEEEIRGWCNKAGCEDELKDISFNEHKVNGKSKG
jgi:hypothetical protein